MINCHSRGRGGFVSRGIIGMAYPALLPQGGMGTSLARSMSSWRIWRSGSQVCKTKQAEQVLRFAFHHVSCVGIFGITFKGVAKNCSRSVNYSLMAGLSKSLWDSVVAWVLDCGGMFCKHTVHGHKRTERPQLKSATSLLCSLELTLQSEMSVFPPSLTEYDRI